MIVAVANVKWMLLFLLRPTSDIDREVRMLQLLLLLLSSSLISSLEAFSVHNRWARFVVFLFADPHLLEC